MPRQGYIGIYDSGTWERYKDSKGRARKRMGKKELTNTEFVGAMLDVYEHHLRTENEPTIND